MLKVPPGCECKSNKHETPFSCEEFDCLSSPDIDIPIKSNSIPQSLGEYIKYYFRSVLEVQRDNSAVKGVFFKHRSTLDVVHDEHIGFNLLETKSVVENNDLIAPGYKSGQSVGVARSDNDTIIASIFSPPTSRRGGRCDWEHDPFQIKFGENVLSACSISCNLSELKLMCDSSLQSWLQHNVTLFGIFNNADVNEIHHWLQIEKVQSNLNFTWVEDLRACLGIATNLRYDIYWTYVGALSNPQAKILHVTETLVPTDALVHDADDFEAKLTYTFTTTVSWIYVQGDQDPLILPPPEWLFSVPEDFFYPFGYSSSSSQSSLNVSIVFMIISVFFIGFVCG